MTEQPELEIVRISHEVTSRMMEKMNTSNNGPITTVAVPEEFHDQYKKKFELFKRFDQCAEKIKDYILSAANFSANPQGFTLEIPAFLHPFLQEKDNINWDLDSRMEVFETLLERMERKLNTETFLAKLGEKLDSKINYIILINSGYSEKPGEKYKVTADFTISA